MTENIKGDVKAILQVQNETLNDKYSGLPSDVGSSKNDAFKYLKERLWGRVKGWLEKPFSTAGKEVLINLVAQAVLFYSMSFLKLPRGLIEQLKKKVRHFWGGSKNGARKVVWVSWSDMT